MNDTKIERITFFVHGLPVAQGSKRAFALKKNNAYTGRTVMLESGGEKLRNWRQDVKAAAIQAAKDAGLESPLKQPLKLSVDFIFPRPKSHYRTGKNANVQRPDAPFYHTAKPDLGKLIRAVEDSITGVIWHDDSCVAYYFATRKRYAEFGQPAGATITIETLH